MTKLIVFPGNSQRNKEWGEGALTHFASRFDEAEMLYYDHWTNGKENIDFEVELEKLSKMVTTSPLETVFYVFAKSAGTILTLLAVQRNIISPQQCLFFGMPLEWADKDVFKGDWSPLQNFNVPTLAFHNDNDPTANYGFTIEAIRKHSAGNIRLVTTAGDNHSYAEFEKYTATVTDFLQV